MIALVPRIKCLQSKFLLKINTLIQYNTELKHSSIKQICEDSSCHWSHSPIHVHGFMQSQSCLAWTRSLVLVWAIFLNFLVLKCCVLSLRSHDLLPEPVLMAPDISKYAAKVIFLLSYDMIWFSSIICPCVCEYPGESVQTIHRSLALFIPYLAFLSSFKKCSCQRSEKT